MSVSVVTSDVMTPSQRKKAMTHNRGRTGPERALASALWRKGLRYLTDVGYRKLTGKSLPGRPDLIFSSRRVAVFVDGCFWHGCPECAKVPQDMSEFWLSKIHANQTRDVRVSHELEQLGWHVVRVPEHAVRRRDRLSETAQSLENLLASTTTRKRRRT